MRPILLLQPSTGWWDSLQGRALPLAVLHASALAQQRFRVILLDLRYHRPWEPELRRILQDERPFLVGLTAMLGPQITEATRASRLVKELLPDAAVVWGGAFSTLTPQLVLSEPALDFVISGEGEQTLLSLAEALRDGGLDAAAGVTNVLRRGADGLPVGDISGGHLELDDLPPLPYGLLDSSRYGHQYKGGEVLSLESSRGCPHDCMFCCIPNLCGRRWRARSAGRVAEDVDHLLGQFSPRRVFFVDDNFFGSPARAMAIAEQMARRRLAWGTHGLTPTVAQHLDRPYLRALARSGCDELKLGLENILPKNQLYMGKRFDPEAFRAFNARLAEFDISVKYTLIVGFPDEDLEDIRQNVEYVFCLLRENPNASLYSIYPLFPCPGTRLFQECTDEAWQAQWTLQRCARFEVNSAGGPWLDPDRLRLLQDIYYASLFISEKKLIYSRAFSALIEAARRAYAPLARRRLRRLDFGFSPETRLLHQAVSLAAEHLR